MVNFLCKTTTEVKERKEIDYSNIKEAEIIVEEVNKRDSKGLHTNLFIIGLPGSGKSSASQRIAELISETREAKPKIEIVDSLLKLLKAIRDSRVGDIIIVEEVSVLFPSRRAMAAENVAVGRIFDTIRKKRLCLIANAPIWGSIDSHMRCMGSILIETLRINKKEGVVISKCHRLQTNPSSGKTYRHTMQKNGFDMARIITRKPNTKRWDEYEKDKDKFLDKLYENLSFKVRKKEEKENGGGVDRGGVREDFEKKFKVYIDYVVNKMPRSEVAKKHSMGCSRVSQIKGEFKEIMENAKEIEQN